MQKFYAGVVQLASVDDHQYNMQLIEEGIRVAVEQGAQFVLLPETSDYIGPDMLNQATTVPGYWTRFYSRVSRQHGIYLHCGSLTIKGEDGRFRNKSLVFDPNGQIIAEYDKIHMFDVQGSVNRRESDMITPGNDIVLVDTPLATLGMSICYDLRFPEMYRIMTLNGASCLLVPANFTKVTGQIAWEALLKARAIENGCYVIAANQCGPESYGHSMIISPRGEILVEAGDSMEVLTAELDPMEVINAREEIPALNSRRDDVYECTSGSISYYE